MNKPKKVKIVPLKGSGPGGQHRNKRLTGIRVIDFVTGLVATATERRSQGQNLKNALERLDQKIEKLNFKPTPRKKSKVKNSAKRKRLQNKKLHGDKKKNRRSKGEW